jgi:uncharacterized membrane protein
MNAQPDNQRPVVSAFPFWLLPLAASWGYGTWLYFQLPASVPAHWNFAGQIDRYGAPWEAAFLLPGVMLLVAALLYFVGRSKPDMQLLCGTILAFMFCIHLVIGSAAATGKLPTLIFGASPVLGLVPLVLSWMYGGWLYSRLPSVVPIHWGLHGEPDGFAGRAGGAFMLPAIMTVMSGVMLALTRQAPIILVTLFLFALQVVVSRIQLRYTPSP